jgi:hypothetical protein
MKKKEWSFAVTIKKRKKGWLKFVVCVKSNIQDKERVGM